jgi:fermentation-respiration switch protein FrsA (DUF1100 family)
MTDTAAPPVQPSRLRSVLAILALFEVPFWTKSWPRRVLRRVMSCLYALVVAMLILLPFENRFAFPGASFDSGWHEPSPELNIKQLNLTARDGNTIHAWFTAPDGWKPEQGAVLYSHGNGDNLSSRQPNLERWRREVNRAVLVYDYPGYGKCTGRPTEAGCYAAIDAAHAWLVEEQKVPAKEVILLGSSMGGAMATDLAARVENRMLVLVNTYTSFPDIAQHKLFFLPVRWLVSNRLDNLGKIASVKGPVFIAHGTADRVVPYRMGERLFAAAREPKQFLSMEDHPHMHPSRPSFYKAVRTFLEETRER